MHKLNEGASAVLTCDADCNPLCRFTWYHDNKTALANGDQLSLISVVPENSGIYRCSAENDFGKDRSPEVLVEVQSEQYLERAFTLNSTNYSELFANNLELFDNYPEVLANYS